MVNMHNFLYPIWSVFYVKRKFTAIGKFFNGVFLFHLKVRVKARELRGKKREELEQELEKLKQVGTWTWPIWSQTQLIN